MGYVIHIICNKIALLLLDLSFCLFIFIYTHQHSHHSHHSYQYITFSGTEHYYRTKFADQFPGSIVDVQVGFMGGDVVNPSYRQVCESNTNHVEVAQVIFDNTKADYSDLIRFAFALHDPTTINRQGGDTGIQYQSAIFVTTPEQEQKATAIKKILQNQLDSNTIQFKSPNFTWEGKTITTAIRPQATFYPAHQEHQQYLIKNPNGYCNHKIRCNWTSAPFPTTAEVNAAAAAAAAATQL